MSTYIEDDILIKQLSDEVDKWLSTNKSKDILINKQNNEITLLSVGDNWEIIENGCSKAVISG